MKRCLLLSAVIPLAGFVFFLTGHSVHAQSQVNCNVHRYYPFDIGTYDADRYPDPANATKISLLSDSFSVAMDVANGNHLCSIPLIADPHIFIDSYERFPANVEAAGSQYKDYDANSDTLHRTASINAGIQQASFSTNSITEMVREDAIINDIASTKEMTIAIGSQGEDFTLKHIPATNCALIAGNIDAPNKVVFVRGKSTLSTVAAFKAQAEVVMNAYANASPFKEYYGRFAFFLDLQKIDDGKFALDEKNPSQIKYAKSSTDTITSGSACGSDADEYVFLFGNPRIYHAYAYFGMKVLFVHEVAAQATYAGIFLHETGHAIAGLWDEYFTPDSRGVITFRSNCVPEPKVDFRGANHILYGSPSYEGCYFNYYDSEYPNIKIPYFRPSDNNRMRLDSKVFNDVDCGYLVSAILKEDINFAHARKHWPMIDTSGHPGVPKAGNGDPIGCGPQIDAQGHPHKGYMDTEWQDFPDQNMSRASISAPPAGTNFAPGSSVTIPGFNFTPSNNTIELTPSGPAIPVPVPSASVSGTFSIQNSYSNSFLHGDTTNNGAYSANSDSIATFPSVDLSQASNRAIAFKTSCGTGSDTSDYMTLELSQDGSHFAEMKKWNTQSLGTTEYWSLEVPIPVNYLSSTFAYRFHWKTNATANKGFACYMGDISIASQSTTTDIDSLPSNGTSLTFTVPATIAPGTYSLRAGAFNSQWSNSIPFTVVGAVHPSVTLNVAPSTVIKGSPVTVSWKIVGDVSCQPTAAPAAGDNRWWTEAFRKGQNNGSWKDSSLTVTPDQTYQLNILCLTAKRERYAAQATVTVTPVFSGPPPVIAFNVYTTPTGSPLISPASIAAGQSIYLSWHTGSGGDVCRMKTLPPDPRVDAHGSPFATIEYTPAVSMLYTLECTNSYGTAASSFTVNVIPPDSTPPTAPADPSIPVPILSQPPAIITRSDSRISIVTTNAPLLTFAGASSVSYEWSILTEGSWSPWSLVNPDDCFVNECRTALPASYGTYKFRARSEKNGSYSPYSHEIQVTVQNTQSSLFDPSFNLASVLQGWFSAWGW